MGKFERGNAAGKKIGAVGAEEARRLYATGGYTQAQLAAIWDLSTVQMGRILRGESWRQMGSRIPSEEEIKASAERMFKMQQERDGLQRLQEEARGSGVGMLRELRDAPPPDPLDE